MWAGRGGSEGDQPGDEEIISLGVFKGSFEPGGVYGRTITRYNVHHRLLAPGVVADNRITLFGRYIVYFISAKITL